MTSLPTTTDDRLDRIERKLDELVEQIGQPQQRWLSIKSAASYADLSQESIRKLLSAEKLVSHRVVRGKVLIDRTELDILIGTSTATVRVGRGLAKGTRDAREGRAEMARGNGTKALNKKNAEPSFGARLRDNSLTKEPIDGQLQCTQSPVLGQHP